MIYFDTSYIVRLYLEDSGWQKVRALAVTDHIGCCLHGKAEAIAAFHRKFREGTLSQRELRDLLQEFERESAAGAFRWLPLSVMVITRLLKVYATLPKTVYLRAADSIHLACAAENGIREVYSNDKNLLNASYYFESKAINII